MYAQRRLKKYSSLTGTTRIFRFDHTVTLGFCQLISGHDFPFFYSFNIYRMNNTQLSNESLTLTHTSNYIILYISVLDVLQPTSLNREVGIK